MSAMKYYVRRQREDGSVAWIGILPTLARAERERAAWIDTELYDESRVTIHEARVDIRAMVRAYQNAVKVSGQRCYQTHPDDAHSTFTTTTYRGLVAF